MADEPGDAPTGRDLGRRWRPLLGIGGLFSGVALLMTILGSISLNLALAGMTLVMLGILGAVLWISDVETRRWIFWTIASGIVAGFTATLAYDASKTALSQLDPSPYDPFHALTIFGTLILGRGADPGLILAAGTAFHLLNGTSFGVAYAFLFARGGDTTLRRALVTGIVWGLFLETFQLTLYPGWLDIRTYSELATISALSHVVYGATLGLLARAILPRLVGTEDDED